MNSLINKKEKLYFALCCIFSALIYLCIIMALIAGEEDITLEYSPTSIFVVYLIIGLLIFLFTRGIFIGSLKGNSIKVSQTQFPELYNTAIDFCKKMSMPLPDIYIMQSGGIINSFVTKFLGRNFAVIYSDVLELAYEDGQNAVNFVVAHELAHIKRGHLKWRWLILPSSIVPLLRKAYSRACEYTADSFAANLQPDGAVNGLLFLAAGKKLYKKVNVEEFERQAFEQTGFWVWLSERHSSHPNLTKRVSAIKNCSSKDNFNY
ncbi:peptidase M48 [Clostridium carboxidivorans P7]|uniref:Peptidase M48 Ste24p n=1 Tax=Clostridium carboxidivorans P7 TaxID=536227 RepID=C6PNW4_9CLOT|nr:M48 family metallopeptidase [Clostridium carboxidivorans]AKN31279.1 peptidase M48 [Clostridium carboxidivorans P7]EET89042.1 peptidase M48 Ste24p [Clostridium carboxidivorans P7]EFG88406.1 peptidase, M48 family [Clostridium carboxidivorans P7]